MMKKFVCSCVLLLGICLSFQANAQKINLDFNQAELGQVLEEIHKQTGYVFYYSQPPVDARKPVTIKISDGELKSVLDKLFSGTSITYSISENKIYLQAEKPQDKTTGDVIYTGVILDTDNVPVIGAGITVAGTTNGTITDVDGKFEIKARSGDRLEVSSLGFQTQEIVLGKKTDLLVVLKTDSKLLDEIVVIGYGSVKKSDLTGAVSSVKMDDQPVGTVSSISHALAGKAAGLQVNMTSAAPGAATTFRIRGAASVSASNDPLIIIDGFPVSPMGDLSTSSGASSNISDNVLGSINPNDIESIEVLKDASSTAIYGSRAANGVIIVTTKQGVKGKPKIVYSGTVTVDTFAKHFDMLDARDFMRQTNRYLYEEWLCENKIGVYGGNTEDDAASPFIPRYTDAEIVFNTQDTDWFDEITRTGFKTQHNLSMNGGTDFTKYYISFNYFHQKGLVRKNDITRYTGRVNIDQKICDWLKLGVNLTMSRNISEGSGGALSSAARFNPLIPVKEDDGTWGVNPLTSYMYNPVAMLDPLNDSRKDRLLSVVYAELNPIPELTLRAQVGLDRQAQKNGSYTPNSMGPSSDGRADIVSGDKNDYLAEFTATYAKKLGKHSFGGVLGYSYQKITNENFLAGTSDFLTDSFGYNNLWAGAAVKPSVGSSRSSREMASFFGRVNYNYDERYLITATMRADGSSVFAANNRWGYFPSVAVAWRFTEEEFMSNIKDVLSSGKLRLSYGQTGNASAMDGAITFYKTGYEKVFGGQKVPGVYLQQIGNPDLKWETTSEWNLGLDLGFWDGRFTITAEYYDRVISDLLNTRSLMSYNEVTTIAANIGKTQSRGFELTVGADLVSKSDFTWNSTLTFSLYRDRWLERAPTWRSQVYEVYDGPIRPIYTYVSDGLIQPGDDVSHMPGAIPGQVNIVDRDSYLYKDGAIVTDDAGKPVLAGKPDGKIDDADMILLGSADPDFIGGWNNTFNYKNFDLTIYFYGQFGVWNNGSYFRTWLTSGADIDRGINMPNSLKETWSHDNMDAKYPTMLSSSSSLGTGDMFWSKIWFIRCRNITLGYTLPKKLTRKWCSNFRIYADVNNPFVITPYDGLDPETDNASTIYPNTRGFNIGLEVAF